MAQIDSPELRDLLSRLMPGLRIKEVASPSGQRIVYFGDFGDYAGLPKHDQLAWGQLRVSEWGDVVVKVSGGIGANAITYLQREIRALNSLNSTYYPRMYFDNVYTIDPATDEHLQERLFITVEEFIPSTPLSDCVDAFRTETRVTGLVIELVHALTLLWSRKPPLIHRDIKPENILLRGDGSVVVIDLGIVREQGSSGVTNTEWLWGELMSILVYGRHESGDLPADRPLIDTVNKIHAGDDVGELPKAA